MIKGILGLLRLACRVEQKCLCCQWPSLFRAVIDQGQTRGVRHFLLGATEDTLAALREALHVHYPGATIAGSYAPPFAPYSRESIAEWCEVVRESQADLVWVGLGTPKQDYAVNDLASELSRPCVAVGAAFDFVAGTVDEAPERLHGSGLEWLYRLASEPRRLWRRYLFGNLAFLVLVLKNWRTDRP